MIETPDFLTGNDLAFSPDLQELQTPEGELYLRFYLASEDEFALPATGIMEVMQQPIDRITPIPNASPLLLGTMNLRGQVIWVADLGQFLGDPAILNTDRSEIPVIAIEEQETLLGLAIERLGEMDWLDAEKLQMPTNIPDRIVPFVKGEWFIKDDPNQTQILRLLNHMAILRSARWAA
jgi:purine-binding chemotaxis protein CheW